MSNSSSTVSESVMVPLDRIATNDKGQTRVKVRPDVVRDYTAAMAEHVAEGGLRFPPVILFKDGGDFYWLGDGFHRVLAARKAGLTEIAAEVRGGTQRDALLFGICANGTHGLPRSNADKRHAVSLVLADPEWSQWNDREIARRIQVSNVLVSKMRRSVSVNGLQIEGRKVQRGDSVYEMNVNPKRRRTTQRRRKRCQRGLLRGPICWPFLCRREERPCSRHPPTFKRRRSCSTDWPRSSDRIAQGAGGEVYRQELI
jgi:hypothetical protein